MKTLKERFETKFIKSDDGCWLWTACKHHFGYGLIGVGRSGEGMMLAPRASYTLYVGPIPDGLLVLHKCDVPACVNPQHLFLGTMADNVRDMWAKGRQKTPGAQGERNSHAKLTKDLVLKIKNDPRSYRILAAEFGVCRSNIAHIKKGRTWNKSI